MSSTHQLVLSTEKQVYACGENTHGELGLDDRVHRLVPTIVPSLNGKSIVALAAGRHFSVFLSDNGIVMTCGRRELSAQGAQHTQLPSLATPDILRPRLVDSLLSVDICHM
jgi:NIMA (never in mitosis gene a)-related kinase